MKFHDNIALELPKIYSDTLNLVNDMINGPALNVKTRATHSGYLLNRRVYPGVAMKKSVGSWTTPENGGTASFNKPILLDHDSFDSKKILGRVYRATYYQLKQGDQFLKDFKSPAKGSDHGSGYIILDHKITDPDAIPRILDGRYSTVSTSFNTQNAFCSICGTDIKQALMNGKDMCEHRPGQIYTFEEKKYECYLITGMMDYEECSYLSMPAQPNAFNLSYSFDSGNNGAKDGNAKKREPNISTQDNGSIMSFVLSDNEGNALELIIKEDQQDKLPDIATRFTRTQVAVIKDQGEQMAKTTKKSAEIVESWVEDLDKKEVLKDSKTTPVEEEKKKTEEEQDKLVEKPEEEKVQSDTKLTDKIKSLETALESVTKEKDILVDSNKKLQSSLDTKSELVKELTDENTKLKAQSLKDTARQLAMCRINLQKPGTLGIDSKEKFDEYVDILSKRSVESLRDALTDLLPEVDSMVKNKGFAKASISELTIEDPTLKSKDEKKIETDSKSAKPVITKEAYLRDI